METEEMRLVGRDRGREYEEMIGIGGNVET